MVPSAGCYIIAQTVPLGLLVHRVVVVFELIIYIVYAHTFVYTFCNAVTGFVPGLLSCLGGQVSAGVQA